MNCWFILYRSAEVALKLVQELGRDKLYKMSLKFVIFLPLLPTYLYFSNFYFLNVDHVEWNRMPFEF